VVMERWLHRPLNVHPRQVRLADRPRDQAMQVLAVLGELVSQSQAPSVDQITVGLGDDGIASVIERTLELVGIPARPAVGSPATQTRPVLLLKALTSFIEQRRLSDLAALLRHADVEVWLVKRLGAAKPWLTQLDRYIAEHLQPPRIGAWLGDAHRTAALAEAYGCLQELVGPAANERRPLAQWARPIAGLLAELYDAQPLRRHDEADEPIIDALNRIARVLRDMAELDECDAMGSPMTLAEAVAVVVMQLAHQQQPAEGRTAAVELLGWLELQLDDAPTLIITGMNEGSVPQSTHADAFLPDSIRRALGLMDNDRRAARDRMMLTAMMHSRPNVTLIAGRRTSGGDPLMPSRLLLACDEDRLAATVKAFYEPAEDPAAVPPMLVAGPRNALVIPPPQPLEPINRLRVTAFRDYLACPYRFYLRHVLQLVDRDDQAVEMDALLFGSVAHEVLGQFGRSDLANCHDPDPIRRLLEHELDGQIVARFGSQPDPVVLIQRQLMLHRLEHFARWQSEQSRAGWRILPEHIERELTAELPVDGEGFWIVGRIDRIDEHPEHGHRIIDYKTSDAPADPEQVHRRGPRDQRQWTDLQLPLYHRLVEGVGITGPRLLGYVRLPKTADNSDFCAAPWDDVELGEAMALATQIAGDIRAGRFWPPSEPPSYPDGFEGICMDGYLNRADVIGRLAEVTP
jgi:ATP-dependent helicase/nuclease subunit B